MNKILISMLVLSLAATSCKDKKAEEAAAAAVTAAAKKTADSLASLEAAAKMKADFEAKMVTYSDTSAFTTPLGKRLRADFKVNPTTQSEIDQNIILQYATKNNLDMKRTASGLYYIMEKAGKGASPKLDGNFTAHYKGYFLDGKEFDSSYKNNQPITYPVNQMIKGWQEALTMMKPGGKAKLLIPSALAYGPAGRPGIPQNAVLAFDMELIK